MLTKSMIAQLKAEWEKISRVDPASPAYKKLVTFMNALDRKQLQMLKDANIKWVSSLAINRITKADRMTDNSILNSLSDLMKPEPIKSLELLMASDVSDMVEEHTATPDEVEELREINVAPSAVLLAATVEKARNGDELTTFELAPMIKRLAHSELSFDEISARFTEAFRDVLITKD